MASVDEIRRRFQEVEVDPSWSFEDCKLSDTRKWTHGYHRYPAKFIPQLVERLLSTYVDGPTAHVNDPFMGCGTTIVSALSQGHVASGTDVNQMAHLISKVKATPLDPGLLDVRMEALLDAIDAKSGAQPSLFWDGIDPLIPARHEERIDYWFHEDNKVELGRILRVIQEEEDDLYRDFFLVAFSNILKNCSIWLQGSTKPTRDKKKTPTAPRKALTRQLRAMGRGNEAFWEAVPQVVREDPGTYLNIRANDARQQPVQDQSVDLVVTSSPYVTSYQYADLHQLSTIWLDFAPDLRAFRWRFIGAHGVPEPDRALENEIGSLIVDTMKEKDLRRATEIESFFIDMIQVFTESFRILKPGGRCCYVIGNTRLCDVDILNAEVFAEGLEQVGFVLDHVIKRAIPCKTLPQTRDARTGRFASASNGSVQAYPVEFILVARKP